MTKRGFAQRVRSRVQPTRDDMDAKRAQRPLDFDLLDAQRWNHSIEYHRVLLNAIPAGATRALDVGCGEGLLTRQLRAHVDHVVGVDPDRTSIERARLQSASLTGLEYICDDAQTFPFDPNSFDVVTGVNVIHHIGVREALERMAFLTRPGGTVGVIGIARRRPLADLPWDAIMFTSHLLRIKSNRPWDHGAPMTTSTETFADVKRIASATLAGCEFRHRAFGRYTIVWHKPLRS